ncbi:MAG: hypothetical protein A4E20_03345 [Nitrospira sp. SG-bin2]|nr:MAG: hypothetical protein A4E20_03345 [Nitrospira sp. SG-bin2]
MRAMRFSGAHRAILQELMQSQYATSHELKAIQQNRLVSLIRHAYATVPFYREAFKKRGLTPDNIRSAEDLLKLPVVTKGDVRADPERFLSSAFPRKTLKSINTSGTTGTPLRLWFTRKAIQANYAFFARTLSWAGVGAADRSATFAGRVFIPPGQIGPPYWRHNLFNNNLLMSSYHISEATAPLYFKKLKEFAPVFIFSYPSSIFALAQYGGSYAQFCQVRPRAIVTSSETLLEHQRVAIEGVFGCRVFDQYASAEMVVFAAQCEQGALHLFPEFGITEILNGDRASKVGEPGELICTGFLNWAMPLIRYEIGDAGIWSEEVCSCGRNFPSLKAVVGRMDDAIITPEGRQVGRLDPIFKGMSGIKETQIVQEALDRLTVKMVKGKGYQEKMGQEVVDQLRKRIGEAIKIELIYVDHIERSSTGKFRSVVSCVRNRQRRDQSPGS